MDGAYLFHRELALVRYLLNLNCAANLPRYEQYSTLPFSLFFSLRFNNAAIYIETLRDFYESYVLYSFLQFLIEVLGGEEALIMMLKDKRYVFPTNPMNVQPLLIN